ncbi:hypothetical protein G7054_g2067 [Neopestalotiopsis clavispora]|nr:hypothetical protein G7054_g2067 [Neopestalotiopsis clavispora]
MATKLRSSTGCWTCRLRRKKCDEAKPVCNRCVKLGLECDGYTERPFWMDGGFREKLRAEETKREIRENKGLPNVKSGSTTSKRSAEAVIRPTESQNFGLLPGDTQYQSPLDAAPEKLRFSDTARAIESWQAEDHSALANAVDQVLDGDGSLDVGFSEDFTPASDQDILDFRWPLPGSIEQLASEDLDIYSFLPLPLSAPGTDSSSHTSCTNSTRGRSSVSSNSLVQPTLEEARLLINYLDNMARLQPPFSWGQGHEQGVTADHRAWQFVFVTRTRASYWATLSLSLYAMADSTDWSDCHNLALLELRTSLPGSASNGGRSHANMLDCCFATMQLVFLEMLRGEVTACRAHMTTAISLIANLSGDHTMTTNEVNAADIAALRFMTSSLRCTEMPDNDTTWQDSLASSIAHIASLDAWKQQAADQGTLGPVELVKRATAIEAKLGQVSGRFGHQVDTHVSAALVYLHVVVSGANPRVPDLYNHVHTTIKLLRDRCETDSSSSKMDLEAFTWPLYLAGCLAEGTDRGFILSLLDRSGTHEKHTGSLARVIGVLKECWRLADAGEVEDPDWTSAMSSLGQELIIF